MVNRILIRRKVVQMLYSYLLTQSEFKIDTAPETTSKDKKYAYSVYIDLILLIIELSGLRIRRHDGTLTPEIVTDKLIAKNRVGKALFDNDIIKEAISKGAADINCFDELLQSLSDKIVKSSAYRDYKKIKSPDLGDDVKFWTTIINSLFVSDDELQSTLKSDNGFTLTGFESGIEMLTRSLNSYRDIQMSYSKALKDLAASLDKSYELYYSIFMLIIAITDEQYLKLENAKTKFLATHEELNPDTRFVDNKLVECLRENPQLKTYLEQHPISWDNDPALIKSLLDQILESKIYRRYMKLDNVTFADDCELWRDILRYIIFPSDEFDEALENKSIYWNDDLNTTGTFVLKTLKHAATSADACIDFLPQFKDEEDSKFGPELFKLAVANREEYRNYIDMFINTEQWDPERIAFMDIVVIITALAEILNFPAIPLAVSMNEYTDIANNYSSARSGKFVNGVLYSIACHLNQQGTLSKK